MSIPCVAHVLIVLLISSAASSSSESNDAHVGHGEGEAPEASEPPAGPSGYSEQDAVTAGPWFSDGWALGNTTDRSGPSVTVHKLLGGPIRRNASSRELRSWRFHYAGGNSSWYCRGSCCWRWVEHRWPYSGGGAHNITQDDLISHSSNRQLADLWYGTLWLPKGSKAPLFADALAPCIQPGTIFYVPTPNVGRFLRSVLTELHASILLVTGGSDHSAPLQHKESLRHAKIRHWLATNCDMDATTTPKLSCLPLGLNPWRNGQKVSYSEAMVEALQQGRGLQQGQLPSKQHPKSKLLLVAFNTVSHQSRAPLKQWACHKGPLRNVSTCGYHRGLQAAYKLVSEHAFVLCPRGVGIDTHRTWETLLLGSYPIVESSELDSLFVGLPVLIVRSFYELTEQLLWETYRAFQRQEQQGQWNYGSIYLGHWHAYLAQWRPGLSKQYKIEYAKRLLVQPGEALP